MRNIGKRIILGLFVCLSVLYAEVFESNIVSVDNQNFTRELPADPTNRIVIEDEDTSISVQSNVSGADVYLNGVYMGQTNLAIHDLIPGYYRLELRKRGYITEIRNVHLRRGYQLEFHIDMERVYGYIKIYDVPRGSDVSVENAISTSWSNSGDGYCSYVIKAIPGLNEVTIRSFGYVPYYRTVSVHPFGESKIYADMEPAAFELSDFRCNKKSFNPNYNGRLGSCEFSFYVTANGEATISVTDADGEEVWSKYCRNFTTWNQSCEWDGTSSNGVALPDGMYTATISTSEYSYYLTVSLDRSLVYPNLSANRNGLGGIGNVPVAFPEAADYFMLFGNGGVVVDCGDVSGDIAVGGLFNFSKHFELGFKLALFPGYWNDTLGQIGLGFKFFDSVPVGNVNLCYGGLVRYGLTTGEWYTPSGVDNGSGLGGGGMIGVDTQKAYFGYSCQYVFGGTFGDANIHDYVLNNSIAIALKPIEPLKIGLWGSYFLSGDFDVGAEVCFMPESSAFIVNVKGDVLITHEFDPKVNVGIGLSYLF